MINALLLVPVWMQITHLFIADSLWIALVLLRKPGLRPQVPPRAFGDNRVFLRVTHWSDYGGGRRY